MLRMGPDFRLGDRDRHTDLASRYMRKPCGTLVPVGKTSNKEACRHLSGGKGARQPQQSGFCGNRLLGGRYGTIGIECRSCAREADLAETCPRHPSERVG